MSSLLPALAVALCGALAFASPVSAQALLERVLGQISGTTQVTGIFANTADNIGSTRNIIVETETQTPAGIEDARGSDVLFFVRSNYGPTFAVTADQIGTTFSAPPGMNWSTITIDSDGTITVADTDFDPSDRYSFFDPTGAQLLFTVQDNNATSTDFSEYRIFDDGTTRFIATPATADAQNYDGAGFQQVFNTEVTQTASVERISADIDASVTNILQGTARTHAGIADAVAIAGTTALVGNIATTALGAVNTGDIALAGATLGLTDIVDRAVGGTSLAVQQRVGAVVTQSGTQADAAVIVLNAALNASAVNGAVLNVVTGLDAELGRSGFDIARHGTVDGVVLAGMNAEAISALAGGISTTALGAVNTGAIVSGASRQVAGVVSGIIGGGDIDG